jgi:hypothetical protein
LTGHTRSCGCLNKEQIDRLHKIKKYNTYDLSGEYGIGYTTKGEKFFFDLEDYDLIKDYCWYVNIDKYVEARDLVTNKIIRMHRLVLNVKQRSIEPDHIFHINYDNRKSQLRLATSSQNKMNTKIRSDNKSGIKGVCWCKEKNCWIAYIGINHKSIKLGYFKDIDDAAKVRKEAEEKYFGEYSYNNSMKNT